MESCHDAMKIADVVYKAWVHFDAVRAEPDFFGPASHNENDQENIRGSLFRCLPENLIQATLVALLKAP